MEESVPISYSVPEIMEMAVETEKGGKLFYETVAEQTRDDNLKGLFSYLADEENRHIRVFEDIARTIKVASDEMPANWEEVSLYLKAVTDSRYFLGPDKALVLAKDAKSTSQAVKLALAFEKETLVFYLEATDMVPTLNRPAIEALVREERAHVRKLTGFLQTCQK
jgi:rubrerythrin